jgi:folate-binding protein YgfZ
MNPLWPCDMVHVRGADATSYLQSQLAQDLRALGPGQSTWSFVLAPNGHVDALVELTRGDLGDDGVESYVVRVDAGYGPALVSRLVRFKIRVRVDIESGPTVAGDPGAYLADRVQRAWPAMGAEITPDSIPAEFPDVVAVAVSFAKGCYPGQELVERMASRSASAPRRLVRVEVPPGAAPGDPIDIDGVSVGVLTSVAGRWALGLVKRGVEVDAVASPDAADTTGRG